ncbi:MAG: methyl-accepting chemotaxis protein [Planctomycetes bacterium]|nr:methyl-accepting chemotaxis protein [Planctomycetota bacterium]
MTLRLQLILTMLACCVIPMAALLWIVDGRTSTMTEKTVAECKDSLELRTFDSLEHVRESYERLLENKLESIGHELRTFAANPAVKRALYDFKRATAGLDVSNAQSANVQRALTDQYGRFEAAFASKNDDKHSQSSNWRSSIDPVTTVLQHRYIAANPNPMGEKHRLDSAGSEDSADAYDLTHAGFHPFAREYLETYSYYDIFLVEPTQGRVVYTVFKELDYATRLESGNFANTDLGRAYRNAKGAKPGTVFMTDYDRYGPSYDAPASFVSCPIYDSGTLAGVAIFQFPLGTISSLLATKDKDESEETILIGRDGLMRSDSQLAPKTHSVLTSWLHPVESKIDNIATKDVFGAGKIGQGEFVDQRGKEVLASWSPITAFGNTWALVRKSDKTAAIAAAEAVAAQGQKSRASLRTMSLLVLALFVLACGAVAYYLGGRIVRPILSTANNLKSVAEGEADLTRRLDGEGSTELGQVAHWFNVFMQRMQGIVTMIGQQSQELGGSANGLLSSATQQSTSAEQTKAQASQVAAAAEQMSINLRSVGDASENMSSSIRGVAAAVEQMNSSIADVAKSAGNAASVADEAADLVQKNNDRISKLASAADEIGRVIEAIQDIAEQTNLLALNATIEAARAGEAGKGFSVVAGEVKELARQTAEATEDIRRRIEGIQSSTGSAIEGTTRIADVIVAVNDASRSIARSVSEQQLATQDISSNLSTTSQQVDTVVRNVQESASASREITESIARVDAICGQSVAASTGTRSAGERVHGIARELSTHLSSFKVV